MEAADVLLCCTTSPQPVIDPGWVRPRMHVATIGPRLQTAHELPVRMALETDLIVTDKYVQIADLGERHFLHGRIEPDRYIALSDIVAGRHPGRSGTEQRTLFCSVGLAGTEVGLAVEALRRNRGGINPVTQFLHQGLHDPRTKGAKRCIISWVVAGENSPGVSNSNWR